MAYQIKFKFPDRDYDVPINVPSPILIPPNADFYETNPEDWKVGLKQYLRDGILPLALSEFPQADHEKVLNILLSKNNEHIWFKNFTHITYDLENNYELLENFGDASIKLGFGEFMRKRLPNLTEALASQYVSFFLSKRFLSAIGAAFHVDKWMRSIIKVNISIKEDCIESIFGSLMEIGENGMPKGNGYKLCESLVSNIFANINFDHAELRTNKTTYKEIIDMLHWGSIDEEGVEENIKLPNGSHQITVRIPKGGIEMLNNWKVKYNGLTLGQATAGVVAIAKDLAYKQVIETLANMGITYENISNMTQVYNRQDEGPYGSSLREAELKAQGYGYRKVAFSKPKKEKRPSILFSQLYAERDGEGGKIFKDTLVVVSVTAYEPGRFIIKEKELQKFALLYYIKFGPTKVMIDYTKYKKTVLG